MSLAFNRSTALQRFECGNVIEICNERMFNFYLGLSQIGFSAYQRSYHSLLFTAQTVEQQDKHRKLNQHLPCICAIPQSPYGSLIRVTNYWSTLPLDNPVTFVLSFICYNLSMATELSAAYVYGCNHVQMVSLPCYILTRIILTQMGSVNQALTEVSNPVPATLLFTVSVSTIVAMLCFTERLSACMFPQYNYTTVPIGNHWRYKGRRACAVTYDTYW